MEFSLFSYSAKFANYTSDNTDARSLGSGGEGWEWRVRGGGRGAAGESWRQATPWGQPLQRSAGGRPTGGWWEFEWQAAGGGWASGWQPAGRRAGYFGRMGRNPAAETETLYFLKKIEENQRFSLKNIGFRFQPPEF